VPGYHPRVPVANDSTSAEVPTQSQTVPEPALAAAIREQTPRPSARPPADFGSYEVIEEISRGGVGIVYKARQRGLNRIVALKVLLGGVSATPDQVQRFLHEARAAAKLQHPHIVPIHDFGTQDGQHYFTMDYIEGESLADVIARGPLHGREALELVQQVAQALQYAHEQGVVHRDIKPGNILVTRDGQVKVTDFGLAKETTSNELHLTVTGQVMGTPRYMSPEQAQGRTAHADGRSDVFSLGVTMYEMLTGQPAFQAENVIQILQKIVTEEPIRPHKINRKVHRDVETICAKAMEKTPERRYQTALELSLDITRFLAGEPIEAKAIGSVQRAGRKLRQHSKAVLVYAVALFITINAIILALNARPSTLRLKIHTPAAEALVDGVPLTETDLAQGKALRSGQQHVLRVTAEPLFDPQEFTFTTKPGDDRSLGVTLVRRHGKLAITTVPPDAGVTIVNEDGYRATFQGPTIEQELPTGEYTLLVHKENFLAQDETVAVRAGVTLELNIELSSVRLWEAATSGSVLSVPAVADFDGDGANDVVVGDDDGKIYCFSGRNGIALWVFRADNSVQAPLSRADMNGDGLPDVVVGSTDGRLYCLNGKNGHALWAFDTKGPIIGPALLKDVNGDGIPDAFVGSDDGNLYAVSGKDGTLLWKWTTRGRIQSCLAWVREVSDDAILVGSADRTLYCVRARTGELAWKVEIGVPLEFPPRIEDLEQNGSLVALVPTPRSADDARTYTAVSLASRKVIGVGARHPRWVDLNGDGKPEKLIVSEQGTTCYADDGVTPQWETPYVTVLPSFADVNGDGVLDLIFNNGPDQLLCLSGRDGLPLGRITVDTAVGRGYALDDVDRDGTPDIVVGAGRKLNCYSWNGGRKRWLTRAATYYDAAVVAADGRVVTKTSGGVIASYDPDHAQPVWQTTTNPQPSPYNGVAAGAGFVVDADAVTRRLTAWRGATGELAWSARLPGETNAPIGWPSIVGDAVVVGDGHAGFYCFALADGVERWKLPYDKLTSRAVTDGQALYVADGENTLHCLSLLDGKERWNYPVSDPFPSPPVLVDVNGDGTLDAIAVADNGFVYALNGRDGKRLWDLQVATVRTRTRHRVVLVPAMPGAVPEGVLVTLTGDVLGLDLKRGQVKWKVALGEQVMGEAVLTDVNGDRVPDIIVATMGRRLRCVSGKGDAELWSYDLGAQVRFSVPVVVTSAQLPGTPLVIVGTGPPENGLYCLIASAPRAGTREWMGPWKALTTVAR